MCTCIGMCFTVFYIVRVLCESPPICCLEGPVGEWPGNKPTRKLVLVHWQVRHINAYLHICIWSHAQHMQTNIHPSCINLTAVRSGRPAGRACAHHLSSLTNRQHQMSIRKNTRPNAWLFFCSICRSKKSATMTLLG